MHTLLTQMQATPIVARSQRAAQYCLSQLDTTPDVIISDLRLADNEVGTQVIEFLREEFNAAIPALIVSGDVNQLSEVEAQGFQVLAKPVRVQALSEALSALLASPSSTNSDQA